MAAFNDPEAECRYMQTLCTDAISAREPYEEQSKIVSAITQRTSAALAAWNKDLLNDGKQEQFNRANAARHKAQHEYETRRLRWLTLHNNVVAALKVLSAKRGTVPSCVSTACVTEAQKTD